MLAAAAAAAVETTEAKASWSTLAAVEALAVIVDPVEPARFLTVNASIVFVICMYTRLIGNDWISLSVFVDWLTAVWIYSGWTEFWNINWIIFESYIWSIAKFVNDSVNCWQRWSRNFDKEIVLWAYEWMFIYELSGILILAKETIRWLLWTFTWEWWICVCSLCFSFLKLSCFADMKIHVFCATILSLLWLRFWLLDVCCWVSAKRVNCKCLVVQEKGIVFVGVSVKRLFESVAFSSLSNSMPSKSKNNRRLQWSSSFLQCSDRFLRLCPHSAHFESEPFEDSQFLLWMNM